MMPYFFLIFVISSQSSNMQVVPMQSLDKGIAAIIRGPGMTFRQA